MQASADYAFVPADAGKISQPVIVQYVATPNMLWYAPYCTIGAVGCGKGEATTNRPPGSRRSGAEGKEEKSLDTHFVSFFFDPFLKRCGGTGNRKSRDTLKKSRDTHFVCVFPF